ncbi:MAG: response regulator transcription factor [Bacteroidetes bacterium]|nr:response regulator transcription factor [Bacteroidota bacterium]
MTKGTKVLIVDDHAIVARGLKYLIDLNFTNYQVFVTGSIESMKRMLIESEFTHLILDINLTDGNSMESIPEIQKLYPNLHILVHSMVSEEIYGKKLMQLNISGFLSKNSSESESLIALRIFLDGETYISKNLRKALFSSTGKEVQTSMFSELSAMELKVFGMMLKGGKTKEIAVALDVAQQTIATYKSRIFKKMGTENIFDLKRMAEIENLSFDQL